MIFFIFIPVLHTTFIGKNIIVSWNRHSLRKNTKTFGYVLSNFKERQQHNFSTLQ